MTTQPELSSELALEVDLADGLMDEIYSGSVFGVSYKYEIEEAEDDDAPLVLVAKDGGTRYQVEIDVYVKKLPPHDAAPLVEPVHPDQIPLFGGQP